MKILALAILFVLAFLRVKNTPRSLSKTLWKNEMIKLLKKMMKTGVVVNLIVLKREAQPSSFYS